MKLSGKIKIGLAAGLSLISITLLTLYVISLHNSLQPEVRSDYVGNMIFDRAGLEETNTKINFKRFLFLFVELMKRSSADAIKTALDNEKFPYLEVKVLPQDLRKLNGDMPFSGREYIPVEIKLDDGWGAGKLKYRGANFYHWGFSKRSYSIMLGNAQKFNLVNPKDSSFISDEIGIRTGQNHFGLFSPENEWVGLFVNDDFKGIYFSIEELDDSFAKKYGFDFIIEGEKITFSQTSGHSLFFDAKKWKIESGTMNNDREDELFELLHVLNFNDHKKLFELVDIDYMVRFYSWVSLLHTLHYDTGHNWKLGYKSGKFYPIIWDPMPWMMSSPKAETKVEETISPISATLRGNVYFNQKFAETLWDYVNLDEKEEEITQYIDEAVYDLKDVLDYDIYKGGSHDYPVAMRFPQSTKSVLEKIEGFRQKIKNRRSFLLEHLSAGTASFMIRDGYLYIQYSGIGGAYLDIQYPNASYRSLNEADVKVFNNAEYNDLPDLSDGPRPLLVAGRKHESTFSYARYCPMTYRVPVKQGESLIINLTNSLTDELIYPKEVEDLEVGDCNMNFYNPWAVRSETAEDNLEATLHLQAGGFGVNKLLDFNEKEKEKVEVVVGDYRGEGKLKKDRYSDLIELKLEEAYGGLSEYYLTAKDKEVEGFLKAREVAEEYGLAVPELETHRMSINGFDAGEYLLFEKPEKAFLETNKRTFDTDIYEKKGFQTDSAEAWEKLSGDLRVKKKNIETLEMLLKAEEVSTMIDLDNFRDVYNFLYETGNENPEYLFYHDNMEGKYQFLPYYYSYYKNGGFELKDPLMKAVLEKLIAEGALEIKDGRLERTGKKIVYGTEELGPLAKYRKGEQILLPKNAQLEIEETVVIPSNLELVIEEGVEIEIEKGDSLISYGKVTANGTEKNPISIHSKGKKPFGVFAIVGEEAGGSKIDYLKIKNGSETFYDHLYLSGMFSAYHVPEITITNSIFEGSQSDDGLNIKYGKATITGSTFRKNSADAIDLDFVQGTVSHSTFDGNGNDSIDTSGSQVTVVHNTIQNSGDKCVSIGEKSTATLADNQLIGCNIGIEAKDLSEVTATDITFQGNNTALNAYQKKEFFGGGHITVTDSVFLKNDKTATLLNTFTGQKLSTDDSEIVIEDSILDQLEELESGIHVINAEILK